MIFNFMNYCTTKHTQTQYIHSKEMNVAWLKKFINFNKLAGYGNI